MKKVILTAIILAGMSIARGETFTKDGLTFSYDEGATECTVTYSSAGEYEGEIVIPEKVENGGFSYTVTGISPYAFADCNGVVSVTVPETVVYVGNNAFQQCTALAQIALPAAVESIEDQTFYGCTALVSCSAPGATAIGKGAFSNCTALQNIDFSPELAYISASAFLNCSALKEMVIPEGATLGQSAFAGCTSLKEVALPESLQVIPEYLFSGCTALEEVTLGENVTEIGASAFNTCSSLTKINLGENLEKIGENAFAFCSALELEKIEGNSLQIEALAFTGCNAFGELSIAGVERIGQEAFANSENLFCVKFDESLARIEERAFRGCASINVVECLKNQPPLMANTAFDDAVYDASYLVVPDGRRLIYAQTPPWNLFAYIVELLPDAVEEIENDPFAVRLEGDELRISGNETGTVNVYDLSGALIFRGEKKTEDLTVNLPLKGIYIVSLGGKSIKIAR